MFTKSSNPTPAAQAVLRQAANSQGDAVPAAASAMMAPPAPSGGNTIPLTKPIVTHKGTLHELTLRAPTFPDYIEIGDIDTPVISGKADGDPMGDVSIVVKTNYAAIMKWAASLTGHDQLVLSQLNPDDAGALMQAVRLALKPFQKGNSPATPTS